MRLSRFAILGAAMLGAIGCRDSNNDPTSPTIPDLAYVRYINAIPDTLNTTVRWIDQVQYVPLSFVNVAYRGIGTGGYQGIRLDAHKLRVFTADISDFNTAGNTAILVDTTLTFEKGKYYTILHSGYARAGSLPKQRLVVIEDVLPTPGTNTAIRFINSGLSLGSMDFYALATATTAISGTPTVSALAAQGISPYVTRAPAAFATVTAAVGSTTALFSGTAPVGIAGNPAVPASQGVAAVPAVDPVAGSTVAGSVITAIAFPASVTGSRAASFTTPAVVYFLDKQPPRYTTP